MNEGQVRSLTADLFFPFSFLYTLFFLASSGWLFASLSIYSIEYKGGGI